MYDDYWRLSLEQTYGFLILYMRYLTCMHDSYALALYVLSDGQEGGLPTAASPSLQACSYSNEHAVRRRNGW